MSPLSIFLIALSLSMDAFAVSVAAGASHKKLRWLIALKIALVFALFQMAMPLAGWLAGQGLKNILCHTDHWVAFILLSLIGGKMVFEAVKPEQNEGRKNNILDSKILFALGVATSIDALVAGLSFSFLKMAIAGPIATIGLVTFLLGFFGICIGKKCGHVFENKFEIFGGLVLIGLGLKILISHIFF